MKKAFHKKLVRCSVEAQRELTKEIIPDDRCSYVHGAGAECIEAVIASFLNRPGPHELYLGSDLRVLGDSLDAIRKNYDALTGLNVRIIDLSNPGDITALQMYDRARKGMMWNGDRRRQKSKGKLGGKAKGDAKALRRLEVASSEEVFVRLWGLDVPGLTQKIKCWILGDSVWNPASAARHYAKVARNYRK